MRRPLYFKFLTGLSLLFLVRPVGPPARAWAHAYPAFSVPTDGSTLTVAPNEVKIQFTEGVELEFSRIAVKNAGGETVSQGKVRRIASDTLAVALNPLAPGPYVIEWQVLSVDTHITDGTLRFTIRADKK